MQTRKLLLFLFLSFIISFTTVSCHKHVCSAYSSVNRTAGLKVKKKKHKKPKKRVRQKKHASGLWHKKVEKKAKHK